MSAKHPTKIEELPTSRFYAILTEECTIIPADERSKSAPGHGYPEHSVDYWALETFPTREAWEAEIQRLSSSTSYYRPKFKAVIIEPVKVTTKVVMEVGG